MEKYLMSILLQKRPFELKIGNTGCQVTTTDKVNVGIPPQSDDWNVLAFPYVTFNGLAGIQRKNELICDNSADSNI